MDQKDLIFWTGILADHALFQINALSSQEEAYIQNATVFHSAFQRYNQAVQTAADDTLLASLADDVSKFIDFKKSIVAELLGCNILINYSPGFINHMINEALEFSSLLSSGANCPELASFPATYIKIWIADASGHASAIISSLDAAETILLENAKYHKCKFDNISKKSVEMEMIQNNLGTSINTELLKHEAKDALMQFIAFCKELSTLLINCHVMATGTFSSAIVDHFIREHEYVIGKLTTCT